MKCLWKQTNCSVLADFHDVTFAQSGSNSRFPRDFFAQNGDFVQCFVGFFYFFGGLMRKFGTRTRNSKPRNFFFGAWNFFFGARMKRNRCRNVFAAASGVFSFPVGTFFRTRSPCHFVGGIPRRAFPPVGLPRRECLMSRQKGRFWGDSATFWFPRGACGCVFFALSRPGGRIRKSQKAKMSKLSTRTRKCHIVNIGGVAGMPHLLSIPIECTNSCRAPLSPQE